MREKKSNYDPTRLTPIYFHSADLFFPNTELIHLGTKKNLSDNKVFTDFFSMIYLIHLRETFGKQIPDTNPQMDVLCDRAEPK